MAAAPNSSAIASSSGGPGHGDGQETQILLSSLREVISNQAQEIQKLQKSIKDLTTSNKTRDEEVRVVRHPFHYGFTEQQFRLRL